MFRLQISLIKSVRKCLSGCFSEKVLSAGVRVGNDVPVPVWTPQRHTVTLADVSELSRTLVRMQKESACKPSLEEMEPITVTKKVTKVKRKPRTPWGRKKKVKEAECAAKLLAELPFSSTEVWKELGFSDPEAKGKAKRKRKGRGCAENEEDEEKEKKKKKDSPRPNYFVSIPITNPKIKQGVEVVQAEVLQKDSRLSRALVPVGTLHITLLVTYLSTQEQIDTAALAVEEMEPMLTSLMGGRSLVLLFRGIGHFRQEVAFVQIKEGEHLITLTHIADSVRRTFEEKGIPTGDQKAFKPHLTFIKLSRAPKLRRQGVKKLDLSLFTAFEQREFGEENVCTMDLCSMLKKKDAEGYYHREKTVTFDLLRSVPRTSRTSGKRGPELDDDELLSLSKRLVEDAVSRAVQQYMEETQNGSAPKDEAPPPTTTTTK
ncbi:A-kinase anchor protein 7 isoform 2-T2 [Clarias gariepinus]|uniref:A-kinase anchor protein 7 isoform X2 n=1 Tax=Clarias gariepinus TaxID=13013 RepID=UPI00234D1E65|nr:A-kinase anchor protein 7 isoform X2 [Clarias gariepinus]